MANNTLRDRLIKSNYLTYIDKIGISERDKEVVIRYANGKAHKQLAKEFGVSYNRIRKIIMKTLERGKMVKRKVRDGEVNN